MDAGSCPAAPKGSERKVPVPIEEVTVSFGVRSASLFLPAAGNCNDGNANNVGDNGNYWSSTPNDENNAYNLNFNSGNCDVNNDNRENGFTVRLFCQLPSAFAGNVAWQGILFSFLYEDDTDPLTPECRTDGGLP